MELSKQEKRHECEVLHDFFVNQLEIAEQTYDIQSKAVGVTGAEIPCHVVPLITRAYLEMEACLLEGAYHSAKRTLRWMHETSMIGTVACVNAKLLGVDSKWLSEKAKWLNDPYDKTLSIQQFEEMLQAYDEHKLKFDSNVLYKQIGLSNHDRKKLYKLYSDLCKYVHLSRESFDLECRWSNLQFMPEQFDVTYDLVLRTMDFVFYMESYLCAFFNAENIKTKDALKAIFDINCYPNVQVLYLTNKLMQTF
ncbi:MAG: hypothetical protein LBI79_01060 [Nitrososphaerota archaeon]|nr:hypothetical protein [Nitrososphaerota archaeon]